MGVRESATNPGPLGLSTHKKNSFLLSRKWPCSEDHTIEQLAFSAHKAKKAAEINCFLPTLIFSDISVKKGFSNRLSEPHDIVEYFLHVVHIKIPAGN